jgi:hypothetical protein
MLIAISIQKYNNEFGQIAFVIPFTLFLERGEIDVVTLPKKACAATLYSRFAKSLRGLLI